MARRVPEFAGRVRERGVTLVELLVATAVALVVVLAATAAFVASQRLFTADADAQAVEESLRFAGFVVRSVARQAGYSDHAPEARGPQGSEGAAGTMAPSDDPADLDIVGASDTRVSGVGDSHGAHGTRGINASDSLRVRFFGRSRADGDGTEPDGTMIDCMGFAQPGPAADTPVPADRAWSFFYVAEAADREPELYCKYRSARGGAFSAQPLARGIEVFKVVYGHDADGNGVPEQWLDAAQLEAMAASGDKVAEEWRKVVGLRIGMVARSAHGRGERQEAEEVLYPLGTDFSELSFRPAADGRLRRVATFTVMLRNALRAPAS
ncbi:type IV pilus assembly protein PilW [Variovorax boronicumulans]|uniref:PilW family protein n=1 Tax=Variovorax boronicumulans TaxID=436515 RepID=UPI00278363BB|nr:PilW family protein [Variovorax boronicumulans]MDP9993296.1 type IV pilus assembly protein PilW [Variovorax boronicumulans]MDQ0004837.1 type IV pilus assembly protein PilW [Variovorax boronicumulans]